MSAKKSPSWTEHFFTKNKKLNNITFWSVATLLEATNRLSKLARAKARSVPILVPPSARTAYQHLWTPILSVAAQRALAATLMELPVDDAAGVDGDPSLEDVLLDSRVLEAPIPSRVV